MKILAINGSPRREGNTSLLLREVTSVLEQEGIETETVSLAGQTIRGCTACYQCFANKNKRCAISNDVINDLVAKIVEADGVLLGSPTYFADVTAEMKALIDRTGMVARANDHLYRRKLGGAVIAVRRGGALHVFDTINHFFLINQMIVPGSLYWNFGIGREIGEVEHDQEGLSTMRVLGENMAWLLKALPPRS